MVCDGDVVGSCEWAGTTKLGRLRFRRWQGEGRLGIAAVVTRTYLVESMSTFGCAPMAIDEEVATEKALEVIADGWRNRRGDPDGWFEVIHGGTLSQR